MKSNYTHLTLVLDRSGSMASIKDDMEPALNKYITDQKAIPGDCTVSFYRFDDIIEKVFSFKNLKDVNADLTLEPRNMTALNDAIGRAINETGKALAGMKEEERPDRVMVVIITDGLENSSKEFSQQQIADMIKDQSEKYAWQIVFVGANQDAVLTAKGFNISASNSMTYVANCSGSVALFDSLQNATVNLRSVNYNSRTYEAFTDEDRAAQASAAKE